MTLHKKEILNSREAIKSNVELAYMISDLLGVKVVELIFPQDNKLNRWYIVNSFERGEGQFDSGTIIGYDITSFMGVDKIGKLGMNINQELSDYIESKKARELRFSHHFGFFIYK